MSDAEDRAKQRQYALASARGRWRVAGLGVVLLAAVRLAGLVPVAWSFIVGFAVVFAVVTYAMARVARTDELPPWYTHATLAVGNRDEGGHKRAIQSLPGGRACLRDTVENCHSCSIWRPAAIRSILQNSR